MEDGRVVRIEASGPKAQHELLDWLGGGAEGEPPGPQPEVSAPAPPRGISQLFRQVAPRSSMEAAAVMAYAAVQEGHPGLDWRMATRWAQRVGWEHPADWRHTFANAVRAGLLTSVGGGYRDLGAWRAADRHAAAAPGR